MQSVAFWQLAPTAPAWHLPLWQLPLQQAVEVEQVRLEPVQAEQRPWLQMSEQQSLASVQLVLSAWQEAHCPA